MKQLFLFSADSQENQSIHPKEITHWSLFIDGAARNNPGPAGAGFVIYKNNERFEKHGFYLGSKTNNQAEYAALLLGLFYLKKIYKKGDHLEIFSDSQLLVRQFKGEYRIKHPELKPLHLIAKKLLSEMIFTIGHIMREKNEEADALANEGIDKKRTPPADFLTLLKEHDITW
jgi:ribonuclease HI